MYCIFSQKGHNEEWIYMQPYWDIKYFITGNTEKCAQLIIFISQNMFLLWRRKHQPNTFLRWCSHHNTSSGDVAIITQLQREISLNKLTQNYRHITYSTKLPHQFIVQTARTWKMSAVCIHCNNFYITYWHDFFPLLNLVKQANFPRLVLTLY